MTVATVRRDEARRGCDARPSSRRYPIHDAALEATIYPTICSVRTSGVITAEGLA
jgi:hypothetical protein